MFLFLGGILFCMKYSVVIPVRNEERNIAVLFSELKAVMDFLSEPYEIIFVNDGSTDNTKNEILKLKDVVMIDFVRGYGQSAAFDAGFHAATGDVVISMDGDLQYDPHDIPKLLRVLDKNKLDVVTGFRAKRMDRLSVRFMSFFGRFLRIVFFDDKIYDAGCSFRVYRRDCLLNLVLWGEMHRYMLLLLKKNGAKIGQIKVNHRKRIFGKTKYDFTKSFRGFIDLLFVWFILNFEDRPMHFFGYVSLVSFGISIVSVFFSLLFFVLFLMFSFVSFFLGVITDYTIRDFFRAGKSKGFYQIRKVYKI